MQGQARLLLEDGTLFTGKAFGAEGETTGEVVLIRELQAIKRYFQILHTVARS